MAKDSARMATRASTRAASEVIRSQHLQGQPEKDNRGLRERTSKVNEDGNGEC